MESKKINEILDFIESVVEAQRVGNREFTCPVCGGKAKWSRAECNGHIRAKCDECGITLIE